MSQRDGAFAMLGKYQASSLPVVQSRDRSTGLRLGDRETNKGGTQDSDQLPTGGLPGLGRRVLIVDDDPAVLTYAREYLGSRGFVVQVAQLGAEGLQLGIRRAYDAIILDIRLPDLDGLEVLRRLRAADVRTPVLILTGWGAIESAVQAMKAGATNYRGKPLLGSALIEAVLEVADTGAAIGRALDARSVEAPSQQVEYSRLHDLLGSIERQLDLAEPPALDSVRASLSQGLLLVLASELLDPRLAIVVTETLHRLQKTPLLELDSTLASLRRDLGAAQDASKRARSEELAAAIAVVRHAGMGTRALDHRLVAACVGCQPKLLAQAFKDAFGMDFHCFCVLEVVCRALRMLVSSDEQVAQIAYACGYDHHSQLDRDFMRVLGLTPTAARKTVRTAP